MQSAADPIHDPETGEILDDRSRGPLPPQETAKQWVDAVKDRLGPGATKRQIASTYAADLVAKIATFKPHKGALVWVNQFEQTHASYIDKLDGDLKRMVSDALAEARDRATNPNHDPAMFRDVAERWPGDAAQTPA